MGMPVGEGPVAPVATPADEKRTGELATQISVHALSTQLVQTPQPHRVYSFIIDVSSQQHTVRGRFSMLVKALRDQTDPTWARVSESFPSFHIMKDMVNNETNVALRSGELRAYLDRLLNHNDEGRLIGSSAFQSKALSLPVGHPFGAALAAVAAERRRLADAARAAEAARQASIVKQQHDDCAFAQTFNTTLAYSNVPPGMLTTITFPRPLTFELRNKMWGWGDAVIKGPGQLPWFRMLRTNASIFGEVMKNANFVIATMNNEPLLVSGRVLESAPCRGPWTGPCTPMSPCHPAPSCFS